MNIFHVPSWYPSKNNPIYGTFIQEQIQMLAGETPAWNHAISTWGQGDPDHMLWVGDHLKNIPKLFTRRQFHSEQSRNIFKYHQPAPTWTRKVRNGNLNRLLRINEEHFEFFQNQVGTVNVIHAQATYPAALIAEYLSKKFNIPYFVSIRMSPFPFDEFLSKNGELKSWIRQPLENAKGLIAPSHSLKERLQRFGFTHVHVIPNPVDASFFKPLEGHSPEKITSLTIGRMVPQKGIDMLIQAIAELDKDVRVAFRVGGDGPQFKSYKKLAKEKGVEDRITWLGGLSREQVRDEMQRCSFYVLPSRHETFGNVLLEAMACGKPVVATKCGGPEDIVSSETGALCDLDIRGVQLGILDMLNRLDSYSQDQIRKHSIDRFSSNTFIESLKSIYHK